MFKRFFLMMYLSLNITGISAQTYFRNEFHTGSVSQFIWPLDIESTNDGYILTGKILSSPKQTGFVSKLDSNYNLLWTRKINNGINNFTINNSSHLSNGDCIYSGVTETSHGNQLIFRMDELGNMIWQKQINNLVLQTKVFETLQEDLVFAYNTDSGFYLVKINSAGDFVWAKKYGNGTNAKSNYFIQTSNGDFVFIYTKGVNCCNSFILRTDSSGNITWSKMLTQRAENVVEASNGDLVFLGTEYGSQRNIAIAKLNSSGSVQWSKIYDGQLWESHQGIIKTIDDKFLINANVTDQFSSMASSLIFKIDDQGSVEWSTLFGNPGDAIVTVDILESSDHGINQLCYGNFRRLVLFKTDSLGTPYCTASAFPLVVQASFPVTSNLALSSQTDSVQIDNSVLPVDTNGFIADNTCVVNGIKDLEYKSFYVYPNPFTSQIVFNSPLSKGIISIVDITGKIIISLEIESEITSINTPDLDRGIYFLCYKFDEVISVKKIIKY